MLANPQAWHFAIPGVTTTGPLNQHFLRDIGLIFVFLGSAFALGAAGWARKRAIRRILTREASRVALWLFPNGLMRHQQTDVRTLKQVVGGAPEDPLAGPAVPVSP